MISQQIDDIHFTAGIWPPDPQVPSLVFIHGAGGTHDMWQAQVEGLAPHANTLAVDLPGHGQSSGPGKNRVADYAAILARFIDAAGLVRPIPCGLSMGGAIVQQMLMDRPEAYAAGILISTGAKLRVMPAIFDTIEKNYLEYHRLMAKIAISPRTDPLKMLPFTAPAVQTPAEITIGDFRACDAFNSMNDLGRIQVPVLVITAQDDQLTPPKFGAFLAEKLPHARRVHIADAGHMVPAEKPDQVNPAIVDFLSSYENTARSQSEA